MLCWVVLLTFVCGLTKTSMIYWFILSTWCQSISGFYYATVQLSVLPCCGVVCSCGQVSVLVWSGHADPAAWRRTSAGSSSSWAESPGLCRGLSPQWRGRPAPSASPRGRARPAARPEARPGARPCRQSLLSKQICRKVQSHKTSK